MGRTAWSAEWSRLKIMRKVKINMEENVNEKKIEELEKKLTELANTTAKTIEDLTAERDAMKELMEGVKTENENMKKELSETKKMNFILAQTKDAKPKESFENALLNLMGVKKSD